MVLLAGILTLSFISAILLTPSAITAARKFNYLDKPSSRKIHIVPTPLLGGVVVLLGFALSFALGYSFTGISDTGVFSGYIVGAILIVLIGLIDDGLGMSPGSKMLGQVLTAILFLTFSRAGGILMNTPLDFTIAILWLITLMNALNFLDNMDGLCSGISFCAALGFAVLGIISNDTFLIIVSISLMGALAGFMFFNLNPAKIFLGDGGSMFLGYTLGVMGVAFAIKHPNPQDLLTPLLIMSYPLFDISFVTFTRLREGRSLSQGGKDHTSHRLVNLGIRSSKAVWGIFIICLMLALLGNLLISAIDSTWKLITVTIVAFLLLVFGVHLNRNFTNVKEKILLLAVDSLGINITFVIFYIFKNSTGLFTTPIDIPLEEFVPAAIWINFYWLFIFSILGQYEFVWDRFLHVEYIKLIKSVLIGLLIFVFLSLDFTSSIWTIILHLLTYGAIMILIIGILRGLILMFFRYYYNHNYSKIRCIIIGSEKTFEWFDNLIKDNQKWVIDVVARLDIEYAKENNGISVENLSSIIQRKRASEVIILEPGEGTNSIHEIIRLGDLMEITFKIFPQLKSRIKGLKTERLHGTGMLKVYSDRMRAWEWGFKRLLDMAGSLVLMILTSPLYLLSMIMIKLNIGGSVLVFSDYYGQGKESIRIPKFRISRSNGSAHPKTFWGKFLLNLGLNKIPMLFSVFTGKISLIGPCLLPLEQSKIKVDKHPHYEYRWAVKPGLISNSSLTGFSSEGYSKHILEMDLQYLEQMSVLMDTKIFITAITRSWLRVLS
ncbi:MAG: hypothetical protein GY855_15885 [candidate division Zixibacteria bacterium]|nr:hypothetical protein [candidate division Zixibacteria bacterium]